MGWTKSFFLLSSLLKNRPVMSMAPQLMEIMGKTDYRLHKLQNLGAVSRSIILQKTQQLREASNGSSFCTYMYRAQGGKQKLLLPHIQSSGEGLEETRVGVEQKSDKEVQRRCRQKTRSSSDAGKDKNVSS